MEFHVGQNSWIFSWYIAVIDLHSNSSFVVAFISSRSHEIRIALKTFKKRLLSDGTWKPPKTQVHVDDFAVKKCYFRSFDRRFVAFEAWFFSDQVSYAQQQVYPLATFRESVRASKLMHAAGSCPSSQWHTHHVAKGYLLAISFGTFLQRMANLIKINHAFPKHESIARCGSSSPRKTLQCSTAEHSDAPAPWLSVCTHKSG